MVHHFNEAYLYDGSENIVVMIGDKVHNKQNCQYWGSKIPIICTKFHNAVQMSKHNSELNINMVINFLELELRGI